MKRWMAGIITLTSLPAKELTTLWGRSVDEWLQKSHKATGVVPSSVDAINKELGDLGRLRTTTETRFRRGFLV